MLDRRLHVSALLLLVTSAEAVAHLHVDGRDPLVCGLMEVDGLYEACR